MADIPEVTKAVYGDFIERFGEPDLALMYDEHSAKAATPLHLENVMVMAWRPTDDLEMTTFATVGMSARDVPGASHRLELVFSIGVRLDEDTESRATRFLANMAQYPWDHERALDWWHILRNPGPIPGFPGCSAILFHPKFVESGCDHVHFGETTVHLLNVVPITELERQRAVKDHPQRLMQALRDDGVDLFRDRNDASRPDLAGRAGARRRRRVMGKE
jgi:hypothetical protein